VGDFNGIELLDLVLTGPRVTLRPWSPTDADAVYRAVQDRWIRENTPIPQPYTIDHARQFVSSIGLSGRAAGTAIDCAVVETATGDLVGSASLRLADGPAEIGYWIAPWGRGNGYATEATRVLAEWGFAHGVHRVALLCDVRNVPSIRAALRAGFSYEGISRGSTVTSPGGRQWYADLARFGRVATDSGEPTSHAFPPFPRDGLSDGVVLLRVMRPEDASGVLESDDAESVRWSFTGVAVSAEKAATAAAGAALSWLVGAQAKLAIVDVATGRFAGEMSLRKPGPPQVGGIGYVVHPAFRGRRFTTRALRLLSAWAFEVGDYARLELGAKVGNEASMRSAASAGFEPDGTRARRLRNPDGSFSDEVRYALINPKYA
jgi:RimJ/RimL family protein N-acetyltransferase